MSLIGMTHVGYCKVIINNVLIMFWYVNNLFEKYTGYMICAQTTLRIEMLPLNNKFLEKCNFETKHTYYK